MLKDKVCIVTGAAVGLGRAFCEQLLKQGAFVSKTFCDSESERFINRLSFFLRFRFLILTRTPANCVASSCNNNSARIEWFSATAMSLTIVSLKVWKINKKIGVRQLTANIFAESFLMTKDRFGRIDILINNAEIRNDKFWELETDVNLVSTLVGANYS